MDKRCLVALVGQLRTLQITAESINHALDCIGGHVDILFVYPNDSLTYRMNAGLSYSYTKESIQAMFPKHNLYLEEVQTDTINGILENNFADEIEHHKWKNYDADRLPYLPVINAWYYKAFVAIWKQKKELSEGFFYDHVVLSRPDLAYEISETSDPVIPRFPGNILDKRDDTERFALVQTDYRNFYYPSSTLVSSTPLKADLIQEMSSSTANIFSGSFLSIFNEYMSPKTFGLPTYHELPHLLMNNNFLILEDVESNPSPIMSKSSNFCLLRGNTLDINSLAILSDTPALETRDGLPKILKVMQQLDIRMTDYAETDIPRLYARYSLVSSPDAHDVEVLFRNILRTVDFQFKPIQHYTNKFHAYEDVVTNFDRGKLVKPLYRTHKFLIASYLELDDVPEDLKDSLELMDGPVKKLSFDRIVDLKGTDWPSLPRSSFTPAKWVIDLPNSNVVPATVYYVGDIQVDLPERVYKDGPFVILKHSQPVREIPQLEEFLKSFPSL